MSIRIVRLGSPRVPGEGVRIGTVRRPPRGIPKTQFASQDWYDVWLPTLAPEPATLRLARAASTAAQWRAFVGTYRAQMTQPAARHVLDVLAALSHGTHFSLGCYCADERLCHRSVLRELLQARGASLAAAARRPS
jgi:uncharacterized protein YeaO (DUF488 family)